MGMAKEDDFVRKIADPKLPTPEEIERHRIMGHFPYRNWCPLCVRAMGKEMPHKSDSGKDRGLPEYSIDYCFPGDELGFKWTVMVMKERERARAFWLRRFR